MLCRLIEQFNASAVRSTCSTAFLFGTGRLPGKPRQTGQHWVFGEAPNAVLQPQNILLAVNNSACTSIPMTVSYRVVVVVILSPVQGSAKANTKATKTQRSRRNRLQIVCFVSFVSFVCFVLRPCRTLDARP